MSNSEVNPHHLEEQPNLFPWTHTNTAQDGTRPQLTAEEFQTMRDDLHTKYYLPPSVQRFVRRTIIALKRVLQRDNTLESGDLEAGNNLLDALEGWIPLSFGNGCISLEVDYIGLMEIYLHDSEILFQVLTFDPEDEDRIPYCFCNIDFDGVRLEDGVVPFVDRLLRETILDGRRATPAVKLDASWEWNKAFHPDLRPDPEWVALREQAKQTGTLPPRSVHWMADHTREEARE